MPSNVGGTVVTSGTGRTTANYIPSSSVVGAVYYYVVVSNACGSVASEVSGLHTVCVAPVIASQTTPGQIREQNVAFAPIAVNVSVGSEPLSYQWYSSAVESAGGGSPAAGGTGAVFTPSSAAVGTVYYYCVVSNGCGGDTSAVSGAHTVCTAPSVSISPSAAQTQPPGGTFPTLTATATGNAPLTYQWYSTTGTTASGGTILPGETGNTYTPSATDIGALRYYVEVRDGCNTLATAISGLHTVQDPFASVGCNSNTPGWGASLGTVTFASATTWSVAGQTWSDAVQATACNKAPYAGGSSGNYNADCRSNPSRKGDLFSWCAVRRFADQLCTGDWRVPTTTEFATLTNATNGANTIALLTAASGARSWGGAYGGYCYGSGGLDAQGSQARYWSSTEYNATYGYFLYFFTGGFINPQNNLNKDNGFSLRCVR
ncbi:MAG: fibrobacter succinogenes major paralogous domain-containing protein [Bacteroidales bacterium]|nr:fibrobacter succinogenes major paralogous domain-containing protein [Bacteroidales bacterium]